MTTSHVFLLHCNGDRVASEAWGRRLSNIWVLLADPRCGDSPLTFLGIVGRSGDCGRGGRGREVGRGEGRTHGEVEGMSPRSPLSFFFLSILFLFKGRSNTPNFTQPMTFRGLWRGPSIFFLFFLFVFFFMRSHIPLRGGARRMESEKSINQSINQSPPAANGRKPGQCRTAAPECPSSQPNASLQTPSTFPPTLARTSRTHHHHFFSNGCPPYAEASTSPSWWNAGTNEGWIEWFG